MDGEKSQKDTTGPTDIAVKDTSFFFTYSKTNKLISALYMVTDVMDKDEPLRGKLRVLGVEVISDIYSNPKNALGKISQILSFLDVARAINLISEMNASVLKQEFLGLEKSVKETQGTPLLLSELFPSREQSSPFISTGERPRVGVQKGSTLMKALGEVSNRISSDQGKRQKQDVLKTQRRSEIINTVKKNNNGASIKDIVLAIGQGEKTIQRELVAMVKENFLYRTGSKRWTRYFLKN